MGMAGPFALDYFVFVFLAALGVLQAVASYRSLQGILFIRSRLPAFLAGFATTTFAFLWFFLSEPRNIPDSEGGLDGNQMSGLFAVAAGSALLLTLILSSISNHRSLGKGGGQFSSGLEALRETTYLNALVTTLRDLWKRYER